MITFIRAVKIFLLFTILTGVLYPLAITGISGLLFRENANGSLIKINGEIKGSKLIGQQFRSEGYFMSRPSFVSYNPLPSGGSNYGLTNNKLKEQFFQRKKEFIALNLKDSVSVVPSEMLFASASGLDPHISPLSANLQIDRIARYRNFTPLQKTKLKQLVINQTELPQFLFLGEERVNVLSLNLALDKIK